MTGSPTNDFSESWGISGIPTVFLIDAEGKLYSTEARGKLDDVDPAAAGEGREHRPLTISELRSNTPRRRAHTTLRGDGPRSHARPA